MRQIKANYSHGRQTTKTKGGNASIISTSTTECCKIEKIVQ